MSKCIKLHQFVTNRAISHTPQAVAYQSCSVSYGITDDSIKDIPPDHFSPSLQMSFNASREISRDGNLTVFWPLLDSSALSSSNLSLFPLWQFMLTVLCSIHHDNK